MSSRYFSTASQVEIETVFYIAYDELMLDIVSPQMFDSIIHSIRLSESVRPTFHSLEATRDHFKNNIVRESTNHSAIDVFPNDPRSKSWEPEVHPPDVTVEEHVRGLNDNMSGAVGRFDRTAQVFEPSKYWDFFREDDERRLSGGSDDATVSRVESLSGNMPFKIITKDELRRMDLFLNSRTMNVIPNHWLTTVWGVNRALEQVDYFRYINSNLESPPADEFDSNLLTALAIRGGLHPSYKAVVYPEDIAPCIGPDSPIYDAEYWYWIRRQGDIWTEMPV